MTNPHRDIAIPTNTGIVAPDPDSFPAVYTGPVTTAQARWMSEVASRATGPNAPAPIIVHYAPPTPVVDGARVDWTRVVLAAITGFVLIAAIAIVAVSCAHTPPAAPPPVVHKDRCLVLC